MWRPTVICFYNFGRYRPPKRASIFDSGDTHSLALLSLGRSTEATYARTKRMAQIRPV